MGEVFKPKKFEQKLNLSRLDVVAHASALRRQMQADLYKFEASLVYTSKVPDQPELCTETLSMNG